ncbi:hypothetical protein C6H69_18265 [Photorhabdus luminescens]|nr:hypothetical protein C6H69_18265 [Photorhabdus luminescens]
MVLSLSNKVAKFSAYFSAVDAYTAATVLLMHLVGIVYSLSTNVDQKVNEFDCKQLRYLNDFLNW